MKENPNIEELLNSFIDGELTERHRVEVQRLIAHDAQVAQRFQELRECKMLVSSLPCAEAPPEMVERIKISLERPAYGGLGQRASVFGERKGARHLLARKVLATAAMIGLVAVLSAVIYTIVAPEAGPERPIAGGDWRQPETVVVTKPKLSKVPASFYGRLELKTSNLIAVDAFINSAIEENGLSDCTNVRGKGDKGGYALSCSREALNLLLADLESVWQRFDSATLLVSTDQFGEQVVVDAVTTEQIGKIVNQGSLEKRMKLAKDFAVLNSMAELLPGKQILAAINDRSDNLITIQKAIPKPVLTSREKAIRKPASQVEDEEKVHLTIVLEGDK